jgi:hypothetical protein
MLVAVRWAGPLDTALLDDDFGRQQIGRFVFSVDEISIWDMVVVVEEVNNGVSNA